MTAFIGGLLFRVALRAGYLLRGLLVRLGFDSVMAIHAGEHGAVNGILEVLRIDMQAYLLPVDIFC